MQLGSINLPRGLKIRPSRDSDKPFLASLYHSTRDDLNIVDAEQDFIETVIEQQLSAQTTGYGEQFPNAMYFIIEKHNEPVGRVVVDFGPNEIRIIDIALITQARNQGFGKGVIQALQQAAAKVCTPLTLSAYKTNIPAYQLYLSLGFQLAESTQTVDNLVWYPGNGKRSIELNR